jgi:hypothetical protein
LQRLPLTRSREREILWTIEWLFEDGSSALSRALNSIKVSTAYVNRETRHAAKRKANTLDEPVLEDPTQSSREDHSADAEVVESADDHLSAPTEAPAATPVSAIEVGTDNEPADSADQTLPPETPEQNVPFIYLVKPRTRGSRRVLIPVDANRTVGDALRNNDVDEFPSFQVLSSPSASLPDGFILLADYFATKQTNNDILASMVRPAVEEDDHESRPIPSCNDIVATIKRDVRRV